MLTLSTSLQHSTIILGREMVQREREGEGKKKKKERKKEKISKSEERNKITCLYMT